MTKSKKIIAGSLCGIFLFSTVIFASQTSLYQLIRDRLTRFGDTYIQKESQLVEDGNNARTELSRYMESLEADFKTELDAYEAQLLEEARREISSRVGDVINTIEDEKEMLLEQIKAKIREKVDKDLEKELKNLEKALRKNN